MDHSFPPLTAGGSNISVLTTAATLSALCETADTGWPARWITDPTAMDLRPEDGDIRVIFDASLTPTASLGRLIKQGEVAKFRNRNLKNMKLISTGASAVKCSISVGTARDGEDDTFGGGGSGGTGTGANQVQGTAARGATASGNPVQVGGLYETTPTVLTNGQAASIHTDVNQNVLTNLNVKLSGENQTADRMMMSRPGTSTRITSAITTPIVSGSGSLVGIFVEVITTGIITIYDNTAASGTTPLIIPAGLGLGFHQFNGKFTTGLTVVTAAADRIVVITEPN